MANIIITRVQYCEKCHKNKRPIKGELFVTIGRKRQKYSVRYVSKFGQMGFTPHIIEFHGSREGTVSYTTYCAMDGCGCSIVLNETTEKYNIVCIEFVSKIITLKEWNDMIMFKDDETFWLD